MLTVTLIPYEIQAVPPLLSIPHLYGEQHSCDSAGQAAAGTGSQNPCHSDHRHPSCSQTVICPKNHTQKTGTGDNSQTVSFLQIPKECNPESSLQLHLSVE